MCQVRKCLCCLSLRLGSMIAAGYTIVLGLLSVAVCAWFLTEGLATVTELTKDELRRENPYSTEAEIAKVAESAVKLVRIVYIIVLVIYAIWLFSGILIFAAVTTKKRGFLLPWIIVTSVLTGLTLLGGIQIAWKIIRGDPVGSQDFLQILILALTLTGNMLAICGVKSYYGNNCRETDDLVNSQAAGMDRVTYKKCSENEMI